MVAENKKDFCFLFYPGDYLRDTIGMTPATREAYDLIMCDHMKGLVFSDERLLKFTRGLTEAEKSDLMHVLEKVDGGYWISWVAVSAQNRKDYTETRAKSRNGSPDDIIRMCLIRDDVRGNYKIAGIKNPFMRYNEANEKYTLLWYSDPVVRAEGNFLREKFKDKAISEDWFTLDKSDVDYISSLPRTLSRTEREIVKESKSEIVIKKTIVDRAAEFGESLQAFETDYPGDMLKDFHDYWTEHGERDKLMRFEKETSFDMSKRLQRWKKNEKPKNTKDKKTVDEQYRDTAQAILRRAHS